MKKILIVDDNPLVLDVLKLAVERLDSSYIVSTYQDSQAAMKIIQETEQNLVIMDLVMRSPNGIQLTELIRAKEDYTPVIWISAYGRCQYQEKADRLGVDLFLEKPINIQDFQDAVRRYC